MPTCQAWFDIPPGPHPGCGEFTEGDTQLCGKPAAETVQFSDAEVGGGEHTLTLCPDCAHELRWEPGLQVLSSIPVATCEMTSSTGTCAQPAPYGVQLSTATPVGHPPRSWKTGPYVVCREHLDHLRASWPVTVLTPEAVTTARRQHQHQ